MLISNLNLLNADVCFHHVLMLVATHWNLVCYRL